MRGRPEPIASRYVLPAVVALAFLAVPANGWSQSYVKKAFTEEEVLALPRACLAHNSLIKSLGRPAVSPEEMKQWRAQLGPGFNHLHHYCWALISMSRATRAERSTDRAASYRNAVANFDYVIKNWDASFPLKPDAHLKKGISLRFLGDDSGAAKEFLRAIRIRPEFTPPYVALADLQVDLGNVDEARQTVSLGLKHAPNSKLLARKLSELEAAESPQ